MAMIIIMMTRNEICEEIICINNEEKIIIIIWK